MAQCYVGNAVWWGTRWGSLSCSAPYYWRVYIACVFPQSLCNWVCSRQWTIGRLPPSFNMRVFLEACWQLSSEPQRNPRCHCPWLRLWTVWFECSWQGQPAHLWNRIHLAVLVRAICLVLLWVLFHAFLLPCTYSHLSGLTQHSARCENVEFTRGCL